MTDFRSAARRFDAFNRYWEYGRIVTDVVVTDEGIFQKEEVPADYGGPELELELVNAVLMVNARSELVVFEFATPAIKDKDRKDGGPIKRDGEDFADATGTSSVDVVQYFKPNAGLDDSRAAAGAYSRGLLNAEAEEIDEPKT